MSNQIRVVNNFVGPEDCKVLMEYIGSVDSQFTEFGNEEKEFTFFANFNDTTITEILNFYGNRTLDFVKRHYDGPFKDYDETKTHLAKFEEGSEMHVHFDSTKPNDIATLIYINDNYEGGEIHFPDHDISIKPKAGDLLCFPDTPEFLHGVNKVSGSSRYTIPRWFTRIV